MKDIGIILKNAREDLDLTQIQVMKLTGINNKTISGYENGISEPDLETFALLVSLYNLSADDLLDIKITKDRQASSLSLEETKLLNCFRSLTEEQRYNFLIMIKALADKNRS